MKCAMLYGVGLPSALAPCVANLQRYKLKPLTTHSALLNVARVYKCTLLGVAVGLAQGKLTRYRGHFF